MRNNMIVKVDWASENWIKYYVDGSDDYIRKVNNYYYVNGEFYIHNIKVGSPYIEIDGSKIFIKHVTPYREIIKYIRGLE